MTPAHAAPVTSLDDRRPKILGAVQLVRRYSKATGTARAVLNVIASYSDASGTGASPGTARLIRETGFSRSTIRRARRTLEDLGEIVIVGGGRGEYSCRYRITLSPPVGNPVEATTYPIGRRVQSEPGEGSERPRGRVQSEPQPAINRPIPEGGPDSDACPTHRGVDDPPPCRRCMKTREANEAIRAQLAKDRLDEARRRKVEEARQESAARAAAAAAPDSPQRRAYEAARLARRNTPPLASRSSTLPFR